MTEALELSGGEKVLEIGTGSGYQTAILAELARQVVSIERHAELSARAGALLGQLGYGNVTLIVGDGTLGWPPAAPYDRILVTAAASACSGAAVGAIGRRGNPGRPRWWAGMCRRLQAIRPLAPPWRWSISPPVGLCPWLGPRRSGRGPAGSNSCFRPSQWR